MVPIKCADRRCGSLAEVLTELDLNLLNALQALLSERHVTRAGQRVGLSQPAMSAALARLRRYFDDELLVREETATPSLPSRSSWSIHSMR